MPHADAVPQVAPALRRPSRSATALALLGLLVPVVPRCTKAIGSSDPGAAFAAWGDEWGDDLGADAAGFLFEWLFAVAPCLLFAVGVYLLLRRELSSAGYPRLRNVLIGLAVPLHVIGYLLSSPPAGQGWGFYLGEVMFGVVGTPASLLVLGVVWAVVALRSRRSGGRVGHEVE